MRRYLAGALIAGILGLVCGCQRLLCSDSLKAETPSPDGRFVAGVFERNCGATTGFVTYVALRSKDGSFSQDVNFAVLVLDTDDQPKMQWTDGRTLMIELSKEAVARRSRMETSWREVTVGYLYPPGSVVQ